MLLEPILDGRADACFGSRFLGGPHRVLYYWHSVGNKLLTTCSNMLTNLNLTDMETCYKAIRGELARSLAAEADRRIGSASSRRSRRGSRASDARIFEVPISYSGRTYAEGKKIGWKRRRRGLLAHHEVQSVLMSERERSRWAGRRSSRCWRSRRRSSASSTGSRTTTATSSS